MLRVSPVERRGLSQHSDARQLVLRGGGPETVPEEVRLQGLAARKQSKRGWYPESRDACSEDRQ